MNEVISMYYDPRGKDSPPHAAQVPNRKVPVNTLTVQGEGEINVRPDQAKITLGIVTENIEVQTAQQENAAISNSVIQALKQLGIEEASIRTATYTVFPRYDYIEGKSILRGYEVEHQLDILIKNLEIIGIVYETAINHGANRSGGIEFIVSNQELFYQEALKKALQNALEKATTIANSIHGRLNRIPIKVTEQSLPQEKVSRVLSTQVASFTTDKTPPIQTGDTTITAIVNVIYSYE
jgi:uncharacterized protein YggE